MTYKAEQYEAMAKHLRESTPNWHREIFGDFKACVMTCDRAPKDAADMLRQAAALLREQAKGAQGDRDALLYLMQQFDSETWECPNCGHAEDTATMDSAYYLREYLEKNTAPRAAVPDGWMLVPVDIHPRDEVVDCSGIRAALNQRPGFRLGFSDEVSLIASWWEQITDKAPRFSAAPSDGGEQGEGA